MALIRIFKTRKDAERAREILKEGGISADVNEDKFNNVPIQKFGIPARFRLQVSTEDFYKAAAFLAQKLKAARSR